MPPQDVPTPQGHAAFDAAAVVVHGHHSPPAVTGHGKERRRRKREVDDDAAGSGGLVVAAELSSGIDAAAAADGRATDGARHHHRPHAPPASERTRTEAGTSKYDDDDGSVRPERGSINIVFHLSKSAPADTARHAAVVLTHRRHKHRAAAGTCSTTAGGGESYYASDDHFAASPPRPHYSAAASASAAAAAADGVPARASTGGLDRYDFPSVAAKPNAFVSGGKHRHRQAAYHADDEYAGTSISSSRLDIREPVAPPPPHHHRPPKPHKDHGAPKISAPAPPPPQEPSEDELLRMGLKVASRMDMDTLRSMVKEHVDRRNQDAEAKEEERPPFWRPLTDDEVDADLRAVYDNVAAQKAAASGSGKRRRH